MALPGPGMARFRTKPAVARGKERATGMRISIAIVIVVSVIQSLGRLHMVSKTVLNDKRILRDINSSNRNTIP